MIERLLANCQMMPLNLLNKKEVSDGLTEKDMTQIYDMISGDKGNDT